MRENEYLLIIKEAVLSSLEGEPVKIVLFGSRARQDYRSASDVDIGILPKENFSHDKLTILRERIENLNVPYKVEVVNFNEVSEDFKREALKEVVVWKE